MAKLLKKKSGFTLIELMIVVAILGILAALAIPAFIQYIRRSKTGEASLNLNSMFKHVTSYYTGDRTTRGMGGTTSSNCTVSTSGPKPGSPGVSKQTFTPVIATDRGWIDLGYTIPDEVYFSYVMTSALAAGAQGACATTAAALNVNLYSLDANGDLATGGALSTFEILVGGDGSGGLKHTAGFYVANELE